MDATEKAETADPRTTTQRACFAEFELHVQQWTGLAGLARRDAVDQVRSEASGMDFGWACWQAAVSGESRRWESALTEVMPPDFKGWHQSGATERPEIAAWVIRNLREREEALEAALAQSELRARLPAGWSVTPNADSSITVQHKDGTGVVVRKNATGLREIPEEVLYILAEAFGTCP